MEPTSETLSDLGDFAGESFDRCEARTPRPTAPAERLAAIDVLRGFSIFGILLVNMGLFSAPLYDYMVNTGRWTSPVDRLAAGLIRALAEGKFYPLFSLLFGLGVSIQMQRVEAPGGRFPRLYARRLLVLLAIGLGHGLLLWYGDILAVYAVLGFLLLLFRRCKDRTVLITAAVVYVLPLVASGGWTAAIKLGRRHGEGPAQIEQALVRVENDLREWAEYSVEVYRNGSLSQIFRHRLENHRHILRGTLFMVPVIVTMFLLGMYIGRRGILHQPAVHRPLLRRLVLWGLPLGLACGIGYAVAFEWGSRFRPSWLTLTGYALQAVGAPLLSFGYAAAVVLLVQDQVWQRRLMPLAAVGRMALTNYLLQTLICTTLFYSYGLGWFGRVGPALGLLLTVVIYAVQVPLSAAWLRYFRFGPMEWVWRTLTYLRWQPLRVPRPRRLRPPTQGLIG